jgi:hypothetical protein
MLTEITEITVLKTYIDELFLEPHQSAVQVAGIVSKFGMNSNHVREKVRIPLAPPLLAKVWQDLASRLQSFVSQKTKYGRYLEPVAVLKTGKVKSSQ